MSIIGNLNPPAVEAETLPGLCKAQPVESVHIESLMEIVDGYDVFLFSAHETLSKNDQTLPSAAVLIPQLRRMGKHVAIFSLEQDLNKDELIQKINHLGLSFANEDLYVLDDFEKILPKYHLTPNHRIMLVSTDLHEEIALGKAHSFTTTLICPENVEKKDKLGIWPHFISRNL